MTAKEYLQQLQRLDIMINQKIKEVDDLRLKSQSTGSIDYSKERVQTSHSGEVQFVKLIDRIIDLEAEINAEIDAFAGEKHKIINQIQRLKNVDEMQVLHKRYVEFLTFERIAVDMNYTIRNIYFIHGRALQNFEREIFH